MDIELFKLLLEGGSTAVIIYMVYDLRREQKELNARVWSLLEFLVRDTTDEDITAVG